MSELLQRSEKLAPVPAREGGTRDWAKHYAALALAAHGEFKRQLGALGDKPEPGSRPDLGYLSAIATSATAAVVAIVRPQHIASSLWNLTPECGALNGEYIDYLAEVLDGFGINPAELYPDIEASDFKSEITSDL